MSSSFLAGSVGTNPVVVRRLLSRLARAGFVHAQTGARGGVRLARPAVEITLDEIYRAVEQGEVLHLHHRPPNPQCPVGGNIEAALGPLFAAAELALEQELRRTSVADVVEALRQRCALPG